jgi:hypothetical protein
MTTGAALSWFAIMQLENRSPRSLLVRQESVE